MSPSLDEDQFLYTKSLQPVLQSLRNAEKNCKRPAPALASHHGNKSWDTLVQDAAAEALGDTLDSDAETSLHSFLVQEKGSPFQRVQVLLRELQRLPEEDEARGPLRSFLQSLLREMVRCPRSLPFARLFERLHGHPPCAERWHQALQIQKNPPSLLPGLLVSGETETGRDKAARWHDPGCFLPDLTECCNSLEEFHEKESTFRSLLEPAEWESNGQT